MSLAIRLVFIFSVGAFGLRGQELSSDAVWLEALLGDDEDVLSEVIDGEPLQLVDEEREELAAFIALSGWNRDLTVALGTGWKENVLLESSGGIDASYSQLEFDFFALRPGSESKAEILFLAYGEYRYFSGVEGMDLESLSLAQGSATWRLGKRWDAGGFFEGMYSVQAFDASESDFETAASIVSVWQPEAGFSFEGDFGDLGKAQWKSKYGLVSYDLDGEDYDRWMNSLVWKKQLSERTRVQLGFDWYVEDYDARTERMSRSVLQDAGLLETDGIRFQGAWSLDFDGGFWRGIKTSVWLERERGAVGDYYDSDRFLGKQSLEFALLGWQGFLSASYGETDYLSRLVMAGSEATRRDRSWRWSLEGTRALGKRFDFMVRCDLTEKDSNAAGLSYDGSGISVGLRMNDLGGF